MRALIPSATLHKLFAGILLVCTGPAVGSVIHVDASASGPVQDGTTWCSAFLDLQDGLSAATLGDEIRVADGTYTPDRGSGDRFATFGLKSGVSILGGFAGCGAPDPDEQNPLIHETVLSGDLSGNDGADFFGNEENSYHVVTASGTDETTVLREVTITAGNANSVALTSDRVGGGLTLPQGSATLISCKLRDNWARIAGAVHVRAGAGTSVFSGCRFEHNVSLLGGGAVQNSGRATFKSCTFLRNETGSLGGAIFASGVTVVQDCKFHSNVAGHGGALYAQLSSPKIRNCVFSGNFATCFGGAVQLRSTSASVVNCTFDTNRSRGGLGGGIDLRVEDLATITNCIFWGNTDAGLSLESAQMNIREGSNPTVGFSTIQGLNLLAGNGNIGMDPAFVDASGPDGIVGTDDDDLRLLPTSPCIDAGDNLSVTTATDHGGFPRFIDYLATVDTGNGVAPIVDMGAFEYHGDCNGNGVKDGQDILDLTSADCNSNAVPDECEFDCNNNGTLDECDIRDLTSEDCDGNTVPDECEATFDCNANGVRDLCDLLTGTSSDCTDNGVPDECDLADGTETDCNANELPDSCEVRDGQSPDCNENAVPDSCDIANSTSKDCNANGIPDECPQEIDCNENLTPDSCELASGESADCNNNSTPDDCDIDVGQSFDCDFDRVPDECQVPVPECSPFTVSLVPVFAPPGCRIVGNELTCLAGGAQIELEIRISDWDPDDQGTKIKIFDVVIDGAGFSSGLQGALTLTLVPCDGVNSICVAAFGGYCLGNQRACSGSAECGGTPSCVGPTCSYPRFASEACAPGFFSRLHPDYHFEDEPDAIVLHDVVFDDVGVNFVIAIVGEGAPPPTPFPALGEYAGTLRLDISADARGSFVLEFTPNGRITTGFGQILGPFVFAPVTVTVQDCNGNGAFDDEDVLTGTSLDCNGNLIPDECDIQDGTSLDDEANGVPDECECPPRAAQPDVIETRNRYLSVAPGNAGQQTALRVKFIDLPVPFDGLNGSTAWVGPPELHSENASAFSPVSGFPDFSAATLVCAPAFMDWSTLGTVHVFHQAIIPGGIYAIQAIDEVCTISDESQFSAPLNLVTSRWGDLVGLFDSGTGAWSAPNGSVGVASDVIAVLDKFRNAQGAPTKARSDLEPAVPDMRINITDVTAALDAFSGRVYPFSAGPAPCP